MTDTITMPCADCGGEIHEFTPEIHEGVRTGDYCGACGWMQRSFAEGKIELAEAALHSLLGMDWSRVDLVEEIETVRSILNMRAGDPADRKPEMPSVTTRLDDDPAYVDKILRQMLASDPFKRIIDAANSAASTLRDILDSDGEMTGDDSPSRAEVATVLGTLRDALGKDDDDRE